MPSTRTCLVATVGTVLGATAIPAAAHAQGPPEITWADCTDLSVSFSEVTARSFRMLISASVTTPGRIAINGFHGYLGPVGHGTSVVNAHVQDPDTDYTYTARCLGGSTPSSATGTVHTRAEPTPPKVRTSGPPVLIAISPRPVQTRVRARASDSEGRPLAVTCTPARVPSAGTFAITCTSAPDRTGRRGTAIRTVHVRGAREQLAMLRASLPAGRLTELLGKAEAAAARSQGAAAVRQLGLAVDELRSGGLPASRKASVGTAIAQVAHVLGHAIPRLHAVRPGEHLWSIARAQLTIDTGRLPSDADIAFAVRRTEASNPRLGAVLQPGVVLVLPSFTRA